jgi:hypothetical protein
VSTEPEGKRSFLARWSRRKRESELERTEQMAAPSAEQLPADAITDEAVALTDADMPPIDTLDEHSDISGFLSPGVSAALRQLALRKVFHLPRFNVRDGLDDFDDDYTRFRALGDTVTAEMRHRAEVEAERLARKALRPPAEGDAATEAQTTAMDSAADPSDDDDAEAEPT